MNSHTNTAYPIIGILGCFQHEGRKVKPIKYSNYFFVKRKKSNDTVRVFWLLWQLVSFINSTEKPKNYTLLEQKTDYSANTILHLQSHQPFLNSTNFLSYVLTSNANIKVSGLHIASPTSFRLLITHSLAHLENTVHSEMQQNYSNQTIRTNIISWSKHMQSNRQKLTDSGPESSSLIELLLEYNMIMLSPCNTSSFLKNWLLIRVQAHRNP